MKKYKDFNYLLEEDFNCEDFLKQEEESLINYFNTYKDELYGFADVPLRDTPINHHFGPYIEKIIKNTFITDEANIELGFNLYVQNSQVKESNYHSHVHLAATICGVFYTNLPKKGGNLEFIHPPAYDENDPLVLEPEINKIYLFPSWLYHKPTLHNEGVNRICINISYATYIRPIVKGYGIVW